MKFQLSFMFITVFFSMLLFSRSGVGGGEKIIKTPETVSYVDLKQYVGIWYEIAKIPNRFQKKCIRNTTATYRFRKDGRIDVINSCINRKGRLIRAKGIAKVVDRKTNSKLKVSFVKLLGIRLFWGDYWIIGLEPDYKYAVIGDSKRKYGWVLARKKVLSDSQWTAVKKILSDQGYDEKRFVKTVHSEQ